MRFYRFLLFLVALSHGGHTAKACVMQGADIIHCAPKSLNDLLFAPFGPACDEAKFLEEARNEYESLSLGEEEAGQDHSWEGL